MLAALEMIATMCVRVRRLISIACTIVFLAVGFAHASHGTQGSVPSAGPVITTGEDNADANNTVKLVLLDAWHCCSHTALPFDVEVSDHPLVTIIVQNRTVARLGTRQPLAELPPPKA